jgi:hypothetical protein
MRPSPDAENLENRGRLRVFQFFGPTGPATHGPMGTVTNYPVS